MAHGRVVSPAANAGEALEVLVIDDEASIRKAISFALLAAGHQVQTAANAEDARQAVARRSFDLAFVDLRLGADDGLALLPELAEAAPWMRLVVITANAAIETAVEAMRRGATDYLPKPFTPAQLEVVLRKVRELRSLERRVDALRGELAAHGGAAGDADLSSKHPAMRKAFELARQIAGSDATVLVRGESGTGKGVLAKAIHRWSERSAKAFVTVACPSLSAELLESELFGHVRGAFTGAVRDNPGRVAAAAGGTLFLDEIGDLPMSLQPKLLRFIQDREYERVGDSQTRKADVRIVTATNADLEAAVAAGRFRQDLFFRLNVIEIPLPPLRERTDDVVPLAQRMLAGLAKGRPLRLSEAACDAMRRYGWPGNVRELRNVIERAAILAREEELSAEDLLLTRGGAAAGSASGRVNIGDPVPLEKVEELHIRAVLGQAPTVEEAARILDMDTVTLWRRRKRYGL